MKNFILTSLIATGLSFSAIASEPAKPAEAPQATVEAKKEEAKTHLHHKMTKEERLAQKLKEAEDLMASLTEKVKTLSDAEKAPAELALAHAKLELDAAKNEHLKAHAMSHINKAKRFLKTVHNKEHKK